MNHGIQAGKVMSKGSACASPGEGRGFETTKATRASRPIRSRWPRIAVALALVGSIVGLDVPGDSTAATRAQGPPIDEARIYLPAVPNQDRFVLGTDEAWEYFPGNQVWALAEAPDGGVWAGSDDGAVRWGPAGSVNLRHRLQQGPARAWSLAFDAEGGLWAGLAQTVGGFDSDAPQGLVHRAADGGLRRFGWADGLCRGWVRSLAAAPDGTLWAACLRQGIARRGPEGGWTRFDLGNSPLASLDVNDLALDAEGGVWLALDRGGVQRIRPDGSWLELPDLPVQSEVTAVVVDALGQAWFAARGRGLLRVAPDGSWERFHDQVPELLGAEAYDLAFANDGSLWIAAWDRVVRRGVDGTWTVERPDPRRSNAQLDTILVDASGVVWVGGRQGLFRRERDGRWSYLLPHDALPDRRVSALTVDGAGHAWVATDGGLVEVWPRGRQSRYEPRFPPAAEPPGSVTDLVADAQGGLWVGTEGLGAAYRAPDGGWRDYRAPEGPVSDSVQAVDIGPRGRVWLGSGCEGCGQDGGVAIRETDGRWTRFAGPGQTWDLAVDYRGVGWLSTDAGGRRLELDGSLVEEPRAEWILGRDRGGNLWLGGDGLYVDRLEPGRDWQRYQLPASPTSIASSAYGAAATFRDVWVIGPDIVWRWGRERWRSYETLAGLPDLGPTAIAAGFFETADGREEVVWIGSDEGLFLLRP